MTEAELAAIAARAQAATPGLWFRGGLGYNGGGDIWCQMPGQDRPDVTGVVAHVGASPTADADAAFIAAAREDVPALLADVARLRAALGEIAASLPASLPAHADGACCFQDQGYACRCDIAAAQQQIAALLTGESP